MPRILKILALLSLALSLSWESPCFAEEAVVIQDSSGFTRAAADVEKTGNVDFTLADSTGSPVSGAEVKLTNTLTQETMVAQSQGGVASFQGIAPGTWTVSTTAADVTFTNVAVVDALAPVAIGVGASALEVIGVGVAGTAAAGAATVGVVDATKSSTNSSDEPLPLSPVS